jgi:hypothetical protein
MTLLDFLAGMITMGYLVAALFFWRFWQQMNDRLFIAFGLAFLLFAINQGLVALAEIPREERSWIYLIRLAGFGLIIFAIVKKNLGARHASAH